MKRVCMLLSISGLLLMPRTAEAQTADTLQRSYQALPDRSNTHSVATATDSPSEPAAHAANSIRFITVSFLTCLRWPIG